MKILIIEPFFSGSHAQWANAYQNHSQHQVEILSLSGHYWKWRMHGGAISLAQSFLEKGFCPDLFLVSDMLDVTTFQSLTRKQTSNIPFAIYFHENQITYPWSEKDRDRIQGRDQHYGFINFASALASERVFFNTQYHLESFLNALPAFLKQFPAPLVLDEIKSIQEKSSVLPLGLSLQPILEKKNNRDSFRKQNHITHPLILWNHRWEFDKNPKAFFELLRTLKRKNIAFHLALLGENFRQSPEEFEKAKIDFKDELCHFGYAENRDEYLNWLIASDILPVTSIQDFFGISVVEAIFAGCYPLLPFRLSYPEIIPSHLHDYFLYRNQVEMVEKFEQILKTPPMQNLKEIEQKIEKWSWRYMAKKYDETFSKIIRSS